jgi:hypothetical protein
MGRNPLWSTPEFHSWSSAKRRCHEPSNIAFRNYGGRGIAMCDEWRYSFATFLADMGPRPPDCTLNRLDNDGPYCKANCAWSPSEPPHYYRRCYPHRSPMVSMGRPAS